MIHPLSKWHEGYTTGWLPNRSGHVQRVPYGCWFYLAPGSGVWLNVSRTRVSRTREDLRAHWHLPHRGSENNDAHFCATAMAHGYTTLQFLERSTPGAAHHAFNKSAANVGISGAHHLQHNLHLQHNMNGLHYTPDNFSLPEIVFCGGPCVQEESTTPCPGVPLRRRVSLQEAASTTRGGVGWGSWAECTCDASWPLLRCEEEESERKMRVDPCPGRAKG